MLSNVTIRDAGTSAPIAGSVGLYFLDTGQYWLSNMQPVLATGATVDFAGMDKVEVSAPGYQTKTIDISQNKPSGQVTYYLTKVTDNTPLLLLLGVIATYFGMHEYNARKKTATR